MKPIIGDIWHGWHAFRRGLATGLYSIDERAEIAQTILRHEDVSTTQEHYLMLKSKAEGNAAMKRFGKVVEKKMAKRRRANVRQRVRQTSKRNVK
jgi:integrase